MNLRGFSLSNTGHAVGTADQSIIAKPSGGHVGVYLIVAHADAALSNPTLTIKDGTKTMGVFPLTAGEGTVILQPGYPAPLDGDLVAVASASGVTISAWARLI